MTYSTHLIITVHGIRTYGEWQSRLKSLLESKKPTVTVVNYRYGYLSILAFLFPLTRWLVTKRFRRSLLKETTSRPWSRIDLVGHSFGTHLIGWGLKRVSIESRPKIHTVILAGSVLKSNFPWEDLIGTSVKRVVNECGTRDRVLVLNQLVVLFTGMAGRIGFHGMTGDTFQNRFFEFGHSGYFLKPEGEEDGFMETYWLTLLTEEGPILPIDYRLPLKGFRGLLGGVGIWALNNAEPIKLTVFVTPFILGIWWIYGLYVGAVARQAAMEANFVLENQPANLEVSSLLAVESLRLSPTPTAVYAASKALPLFRSERVRLLHDDDKVDRSGLKNALLTPDGEQLVAVDYASVRTWHATTGDALFEFPCPGQNAGNLSASLSVDGKRIATLCKRKREVLVWDMATGNRVAQMAHDAFVRTVAINFDGTRLATTIKKDQSERLVTVWDVNEEKELYKLSHEGEVMDVVFSHDGMRLATGSRDDTARIWDVETGEMLMSLQHDTDVYEVAFDGGAYQLVTQDSFNNIQVWSLNNGRRIYSIGHPESIEDFAVGPENTLVVGRADGIVQVSNWYLGNERARFVHRGPVRAVAFNKDGTHVATASDDRTARIWDIATGVELARLPHDGPVKSVAFSPTDTVLVTSSDFSTARIWDTTNRTGFLRFETPRDFVKSLAFIGDGRYIAGVGLNSLYLWDDATGIGNNYPTIEAFLRAVASRPNNLELDVTSNSNVQPPIEMGDEEPAWAPRDESVKLLVVNSDGTRLATAHDDKNVRIWELATGKHLRTLPFARKIRALALSPDGNLLSVLTHTRDGLQIWDEANRRFVKKFWGRDIRSVGFGPNGKRLATGGEDKTARIWDIATGQQLAQLEHQSVVKSVKFNPRDATRLATTTVMERLSRLWDTDTGETIFEALHEDEVTTVAFAPNGRYLATGSKDRTVRVWNVLDGKELARFEHNGIVVNVAFSLDGKRVASSGRDEIVRLWLWQPQDIINEACAHLTRNLTTQEWYQFFGNRPYRATCRDN